MSEHTPGPWTLDKAAGGWLLLSNGSDVTTEPFDCADADARLIAAAPELLDALRYLLENAEAAGWSEMMLSGARAAVAKAEWRTEK
jgi:hypothetical protein